MVSAGCHRDTDRTDVETVGPWDPETAFSPMTKKVLFEPGPGLVLVFGYHEENLRQLESVLKVRVAARGNEVTVRGPKGQVDSAVRVLHVMRGGPGPFSRDEIRALATGRHRDVFRQDDNGRGGGEPAPLTVRVPRQMIVPRGERQADYVKAIRSADVVFGVGPAGTGKTYLAVGCGLAAFAAHSVERIILVRPVVEAGERLGFLPGDVQEKVNPYMRPLYDALHDMIDAVSLRRLLDQEVVEIAPLAYMRGRTLSKAFIILDEAQNTTIDQMKMFLTRLGVGSKVVVTGDLTQIDLPASVPSGLVNAVRLFRDLDGIRIINFQPADVVRHHLVRCILKAYEGSAGGDDCAGSSGDDRAGSSGDGRERRTER